jgi:small subunit ribosomal protein S4
MSTYRGPRVKRMRALGTDLPGLSRKTRERRPHPPGQHGEKRRRKDSDYGRQLKEKQKLRYNYGIGERQLRRLVAKAKRSKGETGKKIIELIERRFDNVVFRAGYARTIPAARQLISHGHLCVNGRKTDVPSVTVREGDVITLRDRSNKQKIALVVIDESLESIALPRPEWIEYDGDEKKTTIKGMPEDSSIPELNIQLVVEYYAKFL